MKRKLISTSLFLITTIFNLSAQITKTKSTNVQCGNQFTQEFESSLDTHEFKINLDAGDKLSIKVVPTGDYLNVRAEIYDPIYKGKKYSPGKIFPEGDPYAYVEPMFTNHERSLKILTGKVSANGIYTILLFNNYKYGKKDARAGEYTIIISCIKKDGTVIEPK